MDKDLNADVSIKTTGIKAIDIKDNMPIVDIPELTDDKIRVLDNLGRIVKDLQKKLEGQRSNTNLEFYVDAQVILDYLTDLTKAGDDPNELPDKVINQAMVPIDWLDGVPIVDGLPVWERLDCEPLGFYHLFKIYRNQKMVGIEKVGTEKTGTEKNNEDSSETVRYARSFENLKEATRLPIKGLYAISWVYHWQMRAQFYDRFKEDLLEKERNRLITLMENKHRDAADKIFEKCMKYLTDLDKSKLEKVNPKQMLDWLEFAVKMDRLALGIPADKPLTKDDKAKIEQTVKIGKMENKTLNISGADGGKYLQELVNILEEAKALPKPIEAQADLKEELDSKLGAQKLDTQNPEVEVVEVTEDKQPDSK